MQQDFKKRVLQVLSSRAAPGSKATTCALLFSGGVAAAIVLHIHLRRRSRKLTSSCALTDYEAIYFGSELVTLQAVPGEVVAFDPQAWVHDFSGEALSVAIDRVNLQTAVGEACADVVVPAVPARELRCHSIERAPRDWASPVAHGPYLKVAVADAPSARRITAVASGARSALMRADDGLWYRLKGCGNRDEGVVVRSNATGATGTAAWRDLRGVAFQHTAIRELYWTARLASQLALTTPSVNAPRGRYLYSAPHAPFGEADANMRPACIVQTTRGDRRLGTHVLAGLALLLPRIVDTERLRRGAAALRRDAFPSARPDPNEVSTAMLASDHMIAKELFWAGVGADAHGLQWEALPRDAACFANLHAGATTSTAAAGAGAALEVVAPSADDPPPPQWTLAGAEEMAPEWRRRWRAACDHLAAVLAASPPHSAERALPYLYATIGRECGAFLRALHAAGASWGTYQDTMCHEGQWHCNAHSNNFVLIPPEEATPPPPQRQLQRAAAGAAAGASPPPMLGYLDLDMAFDRETYVDLTAAASGESGGSEEEAAAADKRRHEQLLEREYVNLLEVLAGGDATSGVPSVALGELEKHPAAVRLAANALNDTLVAAYVQAYRGEPREEAPRQEAEAAGLNECAHALARCAVIVMARCEA